MMQIQQPSMFDPELKTRGHMQIQQHIIASYPNSLQFLHFGHPAKQRGHHFSSEMNTFLLSEDYWAVT
jgi:hypothetical protein